jgi:hypothetical protein
MKLLSYEQVICNFHAAQSALLDLALDVLLLNAVPAANSEVVPLWSAGLHLVLHQPLSKRN